MQGCKEFIILTFFLIVFVNGQKQIGDGGRYKIRNANNGEYLTVAEDGIVGLRTGPVITLPERNTTSQAWTLTWEPTKNNRGAQAFWIQSNKDYLNSVTSYYPEGTSYAKINVWRIRYLGNTNWQIENARTRLCLQHAPNNRLVIEGKCSINSKAQQWNIKPIIVVPEEDDV